MSTLSRAAAMETLRTINTLHAIHATREQAVAEVMEMNPGMSIAEAAAAIDLVYPSLDHKRAEIMGGSRSHR